MSRVTKSNVPAAALRWSIERAGFEFGLTTVTLRKALAKDSAKPDSDGLFSTRQVTNAVFGDLNPERLATQRELTRKYTLNNAILEASVLDRQALTKAFAAIADALSSRIMSMNELPRHVREDLLRELASWPIALEGVARAQTRLSRSKGERPEGDGNED